MKENRAGSGRRGERGGRKSADSGAKRNVKTGGRINKGPSENLRARLSMGWNPEGLPPSEPENGPDRIRRSRPVSGSRRIISRPTAEKRRIQSSNETERRSISSKSFEERTRGPRDERGTRDAGSGERPSGSRTRTTRDERGTRDTGSGERPSGSRTRTIRGERSSTPERPARGRSQRDSSDDKRRPFEKSSRFESKDDRRPYKKDKPVKSFRDKRTGSKRESVLKTGDSVRLNRFISNAGICSRREADTLITNREITVNDKVVTDLGTKIVIGDVVKYKGKKITPEQPVYILLNKPRGYVTTVEDPHADKTVMDLIEGACNERVYPVGRLDKATTGVLLFTNDGELASRLTHPKHKKKKIYHVYLDAPLKRPDMDQLVGGIDIDGETIAVDAVSYADIEDRTQVGVELHTGQNRIVRNLFEALGYKVMKLDRVYFAGLTKKNLPRGKYRHLTEQEITMLRRGLHK